MTVYFTSDQHWGHANIIKFCKRPFESVEEMDREMVERWNAVVDHNDTVYHLGDWTLGNFADFGHVFKQLKGHVYTILGGHDYRWWSKLDKSPENLSGHRLQVLIPNTTLASVTVQHPALHTSNGYLPIVLCHYAMRSWDRSHYGSWHLFGHHHGSLQSFGYSFDVGVDCWEFYPVSLDQVARKMSTLKPIGKVDA